MQKIQHKALLIVFPWRDRAMYEQCEGSSAFQSGMFSGRYYWNAALFFFSRCDRFADQDLISFVRMDRKRHQDTEDEWMSLPL